jgi:nicotinate-nucleotide adenylyltransferase
MGRVLLYGGSLDRVHHGHLIVARYVAEHLAIRRIILIPSARPPHKQGRLLAPAADRVAMCRAAVADDPQFEVDDWELSQPGPNYTLYTVDHFRTLLGAEAELFWLIGMDTLPELETWFEAGKLVDRCTVVTAARPGFVAPDAARLARKFLPAQVERLLQHIVSGLHIEIAARDIRTRVQAGQSIRYLVPEPVRAHIAAHQLYR